MLESMPDAQVITWIAEMYTAIEADLYERARRLWAAAEARLLGWGGISAVASATGISERLIRRRILELNDPNAASSARQRLPGAGRKSREVEQPKLTESLDKLVSPGTRGGSHVTATVKLQKHADAGSGVAATEI